MYRVVDSKRVFEGKVVTVRLDQVEMPDGNVAIREVAETTNAVAIVAIDDRDRVCLLRHYRHPQGGFVWELPAGRLDVENEPPLETAKRELREEAKLQSDAWTFLTESISSPGFATERIHLFLAEHVTAIESDFDAEDEESGLIVEMRPFDQALADIDAQKIIDGKTINGLLLAARRRAK